jgi:hypothetical protein
MVGGIVTRNLTGVPGVETDLAYIILYPDGGLSKFIE